MRILPWSRGALLRGANQSPGLLGTLTRKDPAIRRVLVGGAGLEPATPRTSSVCSTGLS